jgi:uncharacterized protein
VDDKVADLVRIFVSIIWEAFPFVVLGALVAGILEEVVPQQAIAKIVPKNPILGVMLGGVLGIVFPMCECGIVPVMRRLLRKGLPLGTCVAYMLAGPIINLVVISSTIVAFKRFSGPDHEYSIAGMAFSIGFLIPALRIALGFIVAVITALIVQAQYRKHGNKLLTRLATPTEPGQVPLEVLDQSQIHPSEKRAGEKKPFFQRLANISETALHDFVDIMVFLTIGACLAGVARIYVLPDDNQIAEISTNNPMLAILVMMVTAVVMCLCSEADAFVAASFTKLHMSAKLAFLVLGPMFDLKLLLMFTRVFRPKVILTIFLAVSIQVFVYTMLVHYLIPKVTPY